MDITAPISIARKTHQNPSTIPEPGWLLGFQSYIIPAKLAIAISNFADCLSGKQLDVHDGAFALRQLMVNMMKNQGNGLRNLQSRP